MYTLHTYTYIHKNVHITYTYIHENVHITYIYIHT